MKLDARLLNLLGLLVIIAVFALGATSIVLPLFEGVRGAQEEIAADELRNEASRTKLTELQAAEERRGEIEQSLAALRAQMPATAKTDTALQVIENALASSGAVVRSVSFGETAPFTPRTPTGDEAPAAAAPATPPETDTSSSDASTETATADPATEGDASSEVALDTEWQIEVTVSVAVPDEAAALIFLDRLRSDSRILLPVEATFSESEDADTGFAHKLDVKLFAFSNLASLVAEAVATDAGTEEGAS